METHPKLSSSLLKMSLNHNSLRSSGSMPEDDEQGDRYTQPRSIPPNPIYIESDTDNSVYVNSVASDSDEYYNRIGNLTRPSNVSQISQQASTKARHIRTKADPIETSSSEQVSTRKRRKVPKGVKLLVPVESDSSSHRSSGDASENDEEGWRGYWKRLSEYYKAPANIETLDPLDDDFVANCIKIRGPWLYLSFPSKL